MLLAHHKKSRDIAIYQNKRDDKKDTILYIIKQDGGICFKCLFSGCATSYSMVDHVPDINEIISSILPSGTNYDEIMGKLESISSIMGSITPSSNVGKIVDVTAKTLVSAASALVGADAIVNIILTIKDAVFMAIKILGIVGNIMTQITQIAREATQEDTIRMFYDIFNIDFNKGPKGVECHISYILNVYKKKGVDTSIVCNLLFYPLYDLLIDFLGSLLSSIPMTAGAPRVILSLFAKKKLAKKTIMSLIIKFTKKTYGKFKKNKMLSHEVRNMFEKPEELEKYIKCLLLQEDCTKKQLKQLKVKKNIRSLMIPSINPFTHIKKISNVTNSLVSSASKYVANHSDKYKNAMIVVSENISVIAYYISKIFVIVLSLLYISKEC